MIVVGVMKRVDLGYIQLTLATGLDVHDFPNDVAVRIGVGVGNPTVRVRDTVDPANGWSWISRDPLQEPANLILYEGNAPESTHPELRHVGNDPDDQPSPVPVG